MNENEAVGLGLVFLGLLGLAYFLPSLAAAQRCALHFNGIFVVNLFLGWTLLGWVVALAWAVTSPPDRNWQLNRQRKAGKREQRRRERRASRSDDCAAGDRGPVAWFKREWNAGRPPDDVR